jgi:pyruvyl transferase EpsI
VRFAFAHRRLRRKTKIVYALTPPPRLANVGDHAQVVAIREWLKRHAPDVSVVEVDKGQAKSLLPALRWLVQDGDLLLLHSGGNLGDRSMWSEGARRLLIQAFPRNQMVSLPQTIYFSDSPTGRRERERTREIYGSHERLTVIARDPRSGELAAELFPRARTFCMPDFVLSLPAAESPQVHDRRYGLLCLRRDSESTLSADQREALAQSLPYECHRWDTTLSTPISVSERALVLEEALARFQAVDFVVTDRYHGLIFAVLCRKPCVVLKTVDHKLTSAMEWFSEVPFVALADEPSSVLQCVEACLAVETRTTPDWNELYFDKLPALIELDRLRADSGGAATRTRTEPEVLL